MDLDEEFGAMRKDERLDKKNRPHCLLVAAMILVTIVMLGCGLSKEDSSPNIDCIGDIVELGIWRGEPIKWQVLDINDDRAILISKDILTVRQYHGYNRDDICVTWENSDVRMWLNDVFFNNSFTKKEQDTILFYNTYTSHNDLSNSDEGIDIYDKVFLLNINEANNYFENDDARVAMYKMDEKDLEYLLLGYNNILHYSQEQLKVEEEAYRENCLNQKHAWDWWLRSPGDQDFNAAYVDYNGIVNENGIGTISFFWGLRPTLSIDLRGQ